MNQKAFLNNVMPFKDKIFRLAKRMLISQDEAEDATQEMYLKLWIKRDELDTYNNVEALAMTMTKNYCLDRLKSKQTGNLTLVHSNFKSSSEDVHKKLELKDAVNSVSQLISSLPEQQRLVIQLRDVEQYEFEEIERILNMNPSAVRANLSRARKAIREGLTLQNNYEIL